MVSHSITLSHILQLLINPYYILNQPYLYSHLPFYFLLLLSPNHSLILTISSKNRNYYCIFSSNSHSHYLQSALPTGTLSQLKSSLVTLLAATFFFPSSLLDTVMTISRFILPSFNSF